MLQTSKTFSLPGRKRVEFQHKKLLRECKIKNLSSDGELSGKRPHETQAKGKGKMEESRAKWKGRKEKNVNFASAAGMLKEII